MAAQCEPQCESTPRAVRSYAGGWGGLRFAKVSDFSTLAPLSERMVSAVDFVLRCSQPQHKLQRGGGGISRPRF